MMSTPELHPQGMFSSNEGRAFAFGIACCIFICCWAAVDFGAAATGAGVLGWLSLVYSAYEWWLKRQRK
jgi:hypothetical protein